MATDTKLQYWRDRYQRLKAERIVAEPEDPLESLSQTDIAYIAGLIDGEGCISISMNRGTIHVPGIQVIMTAKPVLEWLALKINSTLHGPKFRSGNPRYAAQCEVRLTGRRAIWLCVLLTPFLKVKLRQAETLIEFGETYREGYDTRGIPPDVFAKRQALKERMHLLNRRGFHSDSDASRNPEIG